MDQNSMRRLFASMVLVLALLCVSSLVGAAEELYMITTRDGSTIIAKSYKFTDEYVEFTTENGLPGYIQKKDFVKIGNMVGVQPGGTERIREKVSTEERSKTIWLFTAALMAILMTALLVFLRAKKKQDGQDGTDIYSGRKEKKTTTQGHLSFQYKGSLGRTSKWVIDVQNAYEEEGILYVKGLCATTDKRKTFRADRVIGPVTDLSRDHHAPMELFFTDEK